MIVPPKNEPDFRHSLASSSSSALDWSSKRYYKRHMGKSIPRSFSNSTNVCIECFAMSIGLNVLHITQFTSRSLVSDVIYIIQLHEQYGADGKSPWHSNPRILAVFVALTHPIMVSPLRLKQLKSDLVFPLRLKQLAPAGAGTSSWQSDSLPGDRSRTGSLRRDRVRLPSEPGRPFESISRSSRSCRFSRRSRMSSSRSAVVTPPSLRPALRADCASQLLSDCPVGSNSRASSSGDRPAYQRRRGWEQDRISHAPFGCCFAGQSPPRTDRLQIVRHGRESLFMLPFG